MRRLMATLMALGAVWTASAETNAVGKVSSRIYGPTVDIGCYAWRSAYGLMLMF